MVFREDGEWELECMKIPIPSDREIDKIGD